MNSKPIVIISGEPFGIFNEIFLKIIKKNSFKKPIILIGSKKLFFQQAKKNRYKVEVNFVSLLGLSLKRINNKKINFIDVNFKFKKTKSSNNEVKKYIQKCFDIGLNLLKKHTCTGLINGPINKMTFLSQNLL